jgi:superfamily II DNA or RNA helicase
LGIEESPEAVIRCSPLRPNLRLKQLQLKDKDCAIVYVQQQQRAETVAYELDSQGFSALAYHAGMKPEQRRHVQEKFSRGLVRIVVATIAFGMGIDNAHVRSVIHLTLPKSIENYVQEIGRAGRDGKEARCHLITSEDDAVALRSYAHADTQDRAQVKELLVEIFSQQKGQGRVTKRATKHLSVLLPVDTIEERLDMKSGVITTVLAWLEIRGLIKTLPLIHSTVEIKFFSATLDKLRRRSNLMDAVSKIGKNASRKGAISCSLQQLSEELNTEVSDILLQLDQLAVSSGDDDTPGIQYSTKDPAFHIKVLQQPAVDSLIDGTRPAFAFS